MNKRDSRGRKLYEVDEAYQQKFAELLSNSNVFWFCAGKLCTTATDRPLRG